jgi:hypothetical protein
MEEARATMLALSKHFRPRVLCGMAAKEEEGDRLVVHATKDKSLRLGRL